MTNVEVGGVPRGSGADEVRHLGPGIRVVHRAGVSVLALLGATANGSFVQDWVGLPAAIRVGVVTFLGIYFVVSVPLHDLTDPWFEPPLQAPTRDHLRSHGSLLWIAVAVVAVAVAAARLGPLPAVLPVVVTPVAAQAVVGQLVRIRRPELRARSWVPFARASGLLLLAPLPLHTVFRLWEPVGFPWNLLSTVGFVTVFLLLIGRVGADALALERHYRTG